MLGWTIAFLLIALVASAIGLGVIAGISAASAKFLFFVLLVAVVVSVATHYSRSTSHQK